MIELKKRKTLKYKIWLITLSGVITLATITYFYKDYLSLYYLNYTCNKLKPGDKVYSFYFFGENPNYSRDIQLLRLIRPINKDDVDKMDIELYKKALIKSNLNSSNKPYLQYCGLQISGDSLFRFKTECIGTYVDYKILNYKDVNGKYLPMLYFIIKPNNKFVYEEDPDLMAYHKIPDDYVEADSSFYILYYDGINKESGFFKKSGSNKKHL